MSNRRVHLLTLISYKFLPAKLGGHLAHLYFHNYISQYLDSIVVAKKSNDVVTELEVVKFELIPLFGRKYSPYIPLSYFFDLIQIVREKKIDVLMCSHPYMGITGYAVSRVSNIPMITYSHNIESERFKTLGKWWWKILFYYEKWVMSKSRLTFFVTEEDKQWAVENYKLNPAHCIVSPFGINLSEKPIKDKSYRINLCRKLAINTDTKILYFAGSYNYYPNDEAVEFIIDEIYPRLIEKRDDFVILIVGKGLNETLKEKITQTKGKIVYLGFVEDIREILYSADVMLNPMLSGGGIKTKAVEALGNNIKVVSTVNGSFGLDKSACNGMLWVSADKDWDKFVYNIHEALDSDNEILPEFYNQYYWGEVTKRLATVIEDIIL